MGYRQPSAVAESPIASRSRQRRRLSPSPPIRGTSSGRRVSVLFLATAAALVLLASPTHAFSANSGKRSSPSIIREDGIKANLAADIAASFPPTCPNYVSSPVLRNVYPALIDNIREYGHCDIPLGNNDGKNCKTLRRLHFSKKLAKEDSDLLKSLGFRFASFDDIIAEADFDDCFGRLIEHERQHKTGYQIPKKCKEDPELGAWVTGLRRLGPDGVAAEHREQLDSVGFAWISSRKCGSSFMKNFRPVRDALLGDDGGLETVLANAEMLKWLRSIAKTYQKGNLVQERVEYMDQLIGLDWRSL